MSKINLKTNFVDGDMLYSADLNNNFRVIQEGVNSTEVVLDEAIEASKVELRKELDGITADRGWNWAGSEEERVTFFKGTELEINAQAVKNGQLLYNTETGATALDHEGKRIVTGSGNVVEINEGTTPENIATKIWVNKRKDGELLDVLNYRDNENNEWKELCLAIAGDTLPIGSIAVYPLDNAPANWLALDGKAISRTEYAELFTVLGTTYGAGDGSTTFNIPDFRSRVVAHTDGFGTVGRTNGVTISSSGDGVIIQNYIIKAKQSIGLVGNIVTDIEATGAGDVATSATVKAYTDNIAKQLQQNLDNIHTYTTEEQVVGTYLGLPLYRKVYIGTATSTTEEGISDARDILEENVTNINMVRAEGRVHNTSGSQVNLGYGAGNYGAQVYIYKNNLMLQHTVDIVGRFDVTVYYTKFSDENE